MANQVDYFEIGSPDPDATKEFFGPLFGWVVEDQDGDAPYRMVDQGRGGLWDTSGTGGQNWAIFYVNVDDVEASVTQAVELGGTVVVPVTQNDTITFAHLADPHGNRFAVWHPKE